MIAEPEPIIKALETTFASLADAPRFVAWTEKSNGGSKPIKLPINPKTGHAASSTDPETWTNSWKALKRRQSGIGIVLNGDGLIGIDLDSCIKESGELEPWAQEIVDAVNTYTEYSPSGKGLRLFAYGKPKTKGDRTKQERIEYYWNERYLTITGNHYPGTPEKIENRTDELNGIYEKFLQKNQDNTPSSLEKSPTVSFENIPDDKSRHDEIFKRIAKLKQVGASKDFAYQIAWQIAEKHNGNGRRKLTQDEIRKEIDFIYRNENQGVDSVNVLTSWESLEATLADIQWQWRKRLANGFLHIIAADPGDGKSAVILNIFGKTFILGEPWPDGTPYEGEKGEMTWGEAEAAQKINVIRAKKFKIPLNKIRPVFEDPLLDLKLWIPKHQDALWAVMRRPEVKVGVVDSLRGACKGDENSSEFFENAKILADIARDVNKPLMAIHHLRKRNTEEKVKPVTLQDLRGSSAIVQLSRIVWAIDCPGTERKRLTVVKSNLDTFADPLGFEITDSGVIFGVAPELPRQEGAREKAADLLLSLLRKGPMQVDDIQKEVEGAGLSWASTKKAKEKMGVVSTRDGVTGKWHWALQVKE